MVIQTPASRVSSMEEFEAFLALPENSDRLFELINWEIVEKVGSFTPSKLSMRIGYFFTGYLMTNDIGYVTGEAGSYLLAPGYEVMPDVGYISKVRLPEEPKRQVQGPPDLAVEIKSPNDTKRAMRKKAEDYLAYGARMVWLVFPDDKEVEVYVPDSDVRTVEIDGVLDTGHILPGFKLPVRDIFADPLAE
jgi:Uma2 family endonuclease